MRYYQVLTLALLAMIAFELGSISMKLPTPVVQAQGQLSQPIVSNEHEQIMNRLIALGTKVDALTPKIDALSAKIDTKMGALAQGMDQISNRLNEVRGQMQTTNTELVDLKKQMTNKELGNKSKP